VGRTNVQPLCEVPYDSEFVNSVRSTVVRFNLRPVFGGAEPIGCGLFWKHSVRVKFAFLYNNRVDYRVCGACVKSQKGLHKLDKITSSTPTT
jgi:hypothetical protein